MRQSTVERNTKETQIKLTLNLDARIPDATIATGLGFFDHMLDQLARHGHFGLSVQATGDLIIDSHHLVEDTGLALGDAFAQALGDRVGIARWGEAHVPMDETLSRVVVDLSGRPYCVFLAEIPSVLLGNGFQTEMVREFFFAFATRAKINLHAQVLYGENTHHKVESLFKGLARALRAAVRIESNELPSTKGTLSQ